MRARGRVYPQVRRAGRVLHRNRDSLLQKGATWSVNSIGISWTSSGLRLKSRDLGHLTGPGGGSTMPGSLSRHAHMGRY